MPIVDDIAGLRRILTRSRSLAVVGISANWYRPSFFAAKYMLDHGSRIIPVNPNYPEVLGQRCYPEVASIPEPVDIVDCFRKPNEIVPLATLTHELGGGADWAAVGDWERVTIDLVRLVRSGGCDALSLGLPEIASALFCTGPDSHVRSFDVTADAVIDYGPAARAAALAEVGGLLAEQELWPGDELLAPVARPE